MGGTHLLEDPVLRIRIGLLELLAAGVLVQARASGAALQGGNCPEDDRADHRQADQRAPALAEETEDQLECAKAVGTTARLHGGGDGTLGWNRCSARCLAGCCGRWRWRSQWHAFPRLLGYWPRRQLAKRHVKIHVELAR